MIGELLPRVWDRGICGAGGSRCCRLWLGGPTETLDRRIGMWLLGGYFEKHCEGAEEYESDNVTEDMHDCSDVKTVFPLTKENKHFWLYIEDCIGISPIRALGFPLNAMLYNLI